MGGLAELVSRWGQWLDATGVGSVVGFVASILGCVGVAAAIWQAWRARTAAQAAASAARQARAQLSRFLSATDLSSLIREIEHLKMVNRLASADLRKERCSRIRQALGNIRSRHPDLQSEEQRTMQDAIALFSELEYKMDSEENSNRQNIVESVAEPNRRISSVADDLMEILRRLEGRQSGGEDA
jgi:hypothetical protein